MSSSVGPYLRELRERRGVSLDEIARTTRVGRPYLESLEAGDFSKLPAPVFVRGFILAYCQILGESADEALARYAGRTADAGPVAPAPPLRERSAARGRGPVLASFVLLIVLGVALFGVSLVLQSGRGGERREAARPDTRVAAAPEPVPVPAVAPAAAPSAPATVDDPPDIVPRTTPLAPPAAPLAAAVKPDAAAKPDAAKPEAVKPEVAATPAPAPVPTVTQQDVSAALASVSPPYRLIARATAPTWLRVRTDGGSQVEETIPAGQVREWVSNRPFTLMIGNAGGLKLELNGRALPVLGASGAVISRLVLPSEGP